MSRLVYVALLMLSLIWGGSFYFIKMLLHDFGPWTIVFLRSSCGLAVVVLIMLVFKKPFGWRTIPWIPMVIMALINTAIPWSIIGFSETRLSSSMASILNATTPIWTVVIGILFFRQVSNRNQWLGLAIATIGMIVLLGITPGSVTSVDLLGFVCMLSAACCYGFGSQLSKRLLSKYSMYQITFGTLLTSSVSSAIIAFTMEPISFSHLVAPNNLPMIVGLGVFGSGFAYILYYFIVQKGSPEFASMVTYLVPSTALIWGYALLNEKIEWNMIIGLLIVLAGVFLASKKIRPQQEAHSLKIR
ncbi:DMT family transporter [Paenibacillus albiflavus]|uniref:DMT family transporter n=1 Tax=Paenibacillus albiflavus TaxID=2545760 RepID=A0A4R4E803_9BACL|nr:DMT family transporter [Paenibacillus albiflavus]TCZ75689.1 DMT family transporter [Paenibacillus albiflavus]